MPSASLACEARWRAAQDDAFAVAAHKARRASLTLRIKSWLGFAVARLRLRQGPTRHTFLAVLSFTASAMGRRSTMMFSRVLTCAIAMLAITSVSSGQEEAAAQRSIFATATIEDAKAEVERLRNTVEFTASTIFGYAYDACEFNSDSTVLELLIGELRAGCSGSVYSWYLKVIFGSPDISVGHGSFGFSSIPPQHRNSMAIRASGPWKP